MRNVLIIAAALLPAACAHHREEVRVIATEPPAVVEVERVVETTPSPVAAPVAAPLRRPVAAYARVARYGKRTMASDQVVTVAVPDSGMSYPELFAFVSSETGIRIRYQRHNALIKSMVVSIVGPTRVAKSDLIAWMQDTCAYDGLSVQPFGPADRQEYAVMDMANAFASRGPVVVLEDDLPPLEGRVGLYVSSFLTLPEGIDASRARQALSQMSTKTAALGRINELDKQANGLLVTDFAAIVVAMRHSLDNMAIARYVRSLSDAR